MAELQQAVNDGTRVKTDLLENVQIYFGSQSWCLP